MEGKKMNRWKKGREVDRDGVSERRKEILYISLCLCSITTRLLQQIAWTRTAIRTRASE
jgi:hypothetical protein